MAERKWRRCQDCKKAIYDQEENSCFRCGGFNFEEISREQLLEMKEDNPRSGIIIQTRHWGELL